MQFEQLGPYRIDHAVGRGGMGAVYAAVHAETGQSCAIKVLSGAIADDLHFRERFKAEVETLLTLRHPNIVRLIGYGEQDGRLFYAMELVDGCSLQDILLKKALDWRKVIQSTVQICAALKHAHDHGIIHRDLKPANLLIDKAGLVKLTDFGIAKAFGASQLTADGGIIGTADYMAPEQADGRPITNRTDLYSLGGVMYAMLCRRPPFSGKSVAEILHCLQFKDPPPVRSLAPDTPKELNEIVMHLLAKNPSHRIANAASLSKQLQALEHGLSRRENELKAPAGTPDAGEEYELADEPFGDETRFEPRPNRLSTSSRPTVELQDENASGDATMAGRPEPNNSNNETVSTQQRGDVGNGPTQIDAPQTHFVTVDHPSSASGKRRIRRSRVSDGGHLVESWGSIAVVAVALAAVLGAIWWGMQPPTADTLFDQISEIGNREGRDDGDLLEVKAQMESFLERFPEHPRSGEVDQWLNDYLAYRHWRKLERLARQKGGLESLTDIQQAFVEGYRALRLDEGKARAKFLALPTLSPADSQSEDDRQCIESGRHWARRLKPSY